MDSVQFHECLIFCEGVLLHENGHVLKPVEKEDLGDREIKFYEKLQSSSDPLMQELRQHMPAYYGLKEIRIMNKCESTQKYSHDAIGYLHITYSQIFSNCELQYEENMRFFKLLFQILMARAK